MSGLRKAKKYDWKDSNLALFGSDTEKQVKKESAESEPAWQGAGKEVGLQIWRINKFKVESWKNEDYGKFFSGDSYIILHTYKEEKEIKYDVHFWIGKESTQDEYGTAAYKTVELDTLLNDAAVQHREVEGHESTLFKTYFKTIQYMKGGAATGFRHVKPEEYKPRLLQVKGVKKQVTVTEIRMLASNIKSDDVFILDMGRDAYLWRGSTCNKDESFKAVQFIQNLKSERNGKTQVHNVEEGDDEEFMDLVRQNPDDDDDDDDDADDDKTPKMFRVKETSGDVNMTLAQEGRLSKGQLDSTDVFIIDTTKEVFVWVGRRASKLEKKNGFGYAHKFSQQTTHPLNPITVIKEGQHNQGFEIALSA